MNKWTNFEKIAAGVAVVALLVGIGYYAWQQTTGTGAASLVPPDGQKVYVATEGEDTNDGLTPDSPTRTLTRALEVTKGAEIATIYLIGPEYELLPNDSPGSTAIPGSLRELTMTTLTGTGSPSGVGPRKGKTRVWHRSSRHRVLYMVAPRNTALIISNLWFDGVSLFTDSHQPYSALLIVTQNVFDNADNPISGVPPGGRALVMLAISDTSVRAESNDFNLSRYYEGPSYIAISIAGDAPMKILENDIKFPPAYELTSTISTSVTTKYIGIEVVGGIRNHSLGIVRNTFQTVGGSKRGSILEANPHSIGILTKEGESPGGIEIAYNTYMDFDGLEIVNAAALDVGSRKQDIQIIDNYIRNYPT